MKCREMEELATKTTNSYTDEIFFPLQVPQCLLFVTVGRLIMCYNHLFKIL